MKRRRWSLTLMANRAAESVCRMILEDISGVHSVRKPNIRHPRIVDSVVARNAAVHGLQLRNTNLFQLNAEIARDGAPVMVRSFRLKNRLVLLLDAIPLRQEILPNRSGHQVADGQKARPQQDPAIFA